MGMQRDGVVGTGDPERDSAVIAHFGDGASSQGDVNEAFIFAASYNAPVVFFCQNNQWAISEPIERQTRIPLYQRALGFGFPGIRVDGNDVLATYAVTKAALQRARDGNGPSLRRGLHLPDGCAHHDRRPDPLPPQRRARALEAQGPDRAAQGLPAPQRPGRPAVLRRPRRRGQGAGPPPPRGLQGAARPEADGPVRLRLQRDDRRDRRPARRLRGLPRERSRERTDEHARRRSPSPRASTWACARPWRTTTRSCSWARTSASSAASSASPTACRRTSARTASSTRPLAESGIVGTAVGMALRGYRPVVEIQFDGFVYPAYDQIVCQVAKMTYRSQGKVEDADRHPHPLRRRHRRGRAPLREPGGAVRAHPRPQGRRLLQPGRRLLDDPAGHRPRRPGHLPRAQAAVPRRQGRARRVGDARAALHLARRPRRLRRDACWPTARR